MLEFLVLGGSGEGRVGDCGIGIQILMKFQETLYMCVPESDSASYTSERGW